MPCWGYIDLSAMAGWEMRSQTGAYRFLILLKRASVYSV
jgi:hypothetical protein